MIGVILNPHSGYVSRHGVDHVREMIADILPDAQVHVLQAGDDLAACCRDFIAAGATCIAGAGGDGTINAVASQLVGTAIPLGVIPAGTLNHFARDVGVGRDIAAALHILAGNYSIAVDVARVNTQLFLNNSSIGLYPRIVALRQRHEKRLGKWRAMAHAAWLVTRRARPMDVSIATDGIKEHVRTSMLFVGNNQYELDLLHLGQRCGLDGGQLFCFIMEAPVRLALLPYIFHYLRDHRSNRRLTRILAAQQVIVMPQRKHRVAVACDGEVFMLMTPLVYRILPGALWVVVPRPPREHDEE